MLFSECTGRKVVSTSTADTVGVVAGFLVDPSRRAIAGMHIKKSKSGNALAWSSISACGVDAVTVEAADSIVHIDSNDALAALDGKTHNVLGKRAVSTDGVDLGTVDDVDFDPETGVIASMTVNAEHIEGRTLLGVGSYAVILDYRDRP